MNMAKSSNDRQRIRAIELRHKAGRYIASLRKAANLTQMEISRELGYDYYSFISQVEQGVSRVPPDMYDKWARALHVSTKDFVKKLLSFYEPEMYAALFTSKGTRDASNR